MYLGLCLTHKLCLIFEGERCLGERRSNVDLLNIFEEGFGSVFPFVYERPHGLVVGDHSDLVLDERME